MMQDDLEPERSAARAWPPLSRLIAWEARRAAWARRLGPFAVFVYEFIRFGVKQAWACLFGGLMLGCLILTRFWYPHEAPLARYDFLVVVALLLQIALLYFRFETFEEARVILLFHVIGTAMELFKTSVGSWRYPEAGVLHIGHVPLFSGFMYAAVGSYLARVWRLFDFRFTNHPPLWTMLCLSAAIYANFFADHWGVDLRLALVGVACFLFRRTVIYFKVWRRHRKMPLLLGFSLVAFFIWLGENIGTASGVWLYPNQFEVWRMVPTSKLVSWFLLMLISYTLVATAVGASALAHAPPQPRRLKGASDKAPPDEPQSEMA